MKDHILTRQACGKLPASGTLKHHTERIGVERAIYFYRVQMTTNRAVIRTGSSALAKVATGTGLADRASDAIMNLISAVPSSALKPAVRLQTLARNCWRETRPESVPVFPAGQPWPQAPLAC
jgi:hypothetical protein